MTNNLENDAPYWEEKTHKMIIKKAVELMKAYAADGSNKNVKEFIESLYEDNNFNDCLFQGLKDADDKVPWNNENWAYHFYNPSTKKNYSGGTNTTAHSEARRYFKLSEHYAQRIIHFKENNLEPGIQLYKNAGYFLGLSLHFLTDITQPMHAANFTNIWGEEGSIIPMPDLRHGGFEIYTENAVHRGLLDKLRPLKDSDLKVFSKNNVGTFIHTVATQSKEVFDSYFLPVLRNKYVEYQGYKIFPEGYWRASEADPLIELSTTIAPYTVANYLTNFMVLVNKKPTIVSNKWYEILEPTEAPDDHNDLDKFKVTDLSDGYGQWLYRNKSHGGNQQRFYMLFNEDGTVCIGCKKDGMDRLWSTEDGWVPAWIGQRNTISRETRFRIASFEDNKVMIFESTKNEVVHVNTGKTHPEWHGWYSRFSPAYDNNQWFILREVADMTAEESQQIKDKHGVFNEYNFAGGIGVVPDWERNIPDSIEIDVHNSSEDLDGLAEHPVSKE